MSTNTNIGPSSEGHTPIDEEVVVAFIKEPAEGSPYLERVDTYKSLRSLANSNNLGDELDLERIQSLASRKSRINNKSETENAGGADEDEGVDIRAMKWEGENDRDDPHNWPSWKKWYVTFTVAIMCLVVTLGSSLYVPGVPYIINEFGCSRNIALSGLTFYILGLSLGPVAAAPASELFGRRAIYVTSLPLSMAFTVGVAKSQNIYSILILRFFGGLLASPAMAVAGGTITDIWDMDMIGIAMGYFCFAPFAGPILGPVIGGFVAERKGWRWTIWVQLMFMGVLLPFLLLAPETFKHKIMRNRAKKRNYKIKKPELSGIQLVIALLKIMLTRPLIMLFTEPIVAVLSIYTAFIFAILFGFFEAYPLIFNGVYHMKEGVSGLPFIGIGIGLVFGEFIYIYIDRKIFYPLNPDGVRGRRDKDGNPIPLTPELMLLPCKIGGVLLPPALFWSGWTARKSVHWMAPVAAGIPFGASLLLIFFTTLTYFTSSYPPMSAASAIAANNFARYLLACVFPLFTIQMYQKMGIDWASSFFGFVALILVPVPWLFEKYGARLRQNSTYGYAALKKQQAKESEDEENNDGTDREKEEERSEGTSQGAVENV